MAPSQSFLRSRHPVLYSPQHANGGRAAAQSCLPGATKHSTSTGGSLVRPVACSEAQAIQAQTFSANPRIAREPFRQRTEGGTGQVAPRRDGDRLAPSSPCRCQGFPFIFLHHIKGRFPEEGFGLTRFLSNKKVKHKRVRIYYEYIFRILACLCEGVVDAICLRSIEMLL